ncbi:MAG TPA: helix-turn-helix transcriptional regulator [Thermoanaerobaculia bacterium]
MQEVTRRGDKEKEAILFGEAVRRAREQRGISQTQLAGAAGLSAPYLNVLEHGGNTPTLSVIFRICEALEVEPAVLIDEVWRGR